MRSKQYSSRSKRRRRSPQSDFVFRSHGGRREGAGRKPKGDRAGVVHRTRPALASRFPVPITMRVVAGLPTLRARPCFTAIRNAFLAGREREGFRLAHYSVQSNHIHLIVEAKNAVSLSRGMQGLSIRIARAVNKAFGRKGTLFADRYHAQILRTPRQVRNALRYVLLNARRHASARALGRTPALDRCSSAEHFDGWSARVIPRALDEDQRPVVRARTWLLSDGWRRHGLLSLCELRAPARAKS